MNRDRQNVPEKKSTRRKVLESVNICVTTNAGLWLDRFSYNLAADDDKTKTIELAATKINISAEYRRHFKRWETCVKENPTMHWDHATVYGRMIVGLGAESILETSITLNRTYGVPMIPGSALKGLVRSAAHRLFGGDEWKEGGNSHKIMFGDTTTAGYVTFHDALLVVDENEKKIETIPLDLDVMTVHHQEYYGSGTAPPADWDNPNPVAFVTARGTYLISLQGPSDWAQRAMEILADALQEEGIGAKTAAGYGRMKLERTKGPLALKKEEEEAERVQRERAEAAQKAEEARIEAAQKAEEARIEVAQKAEEARLKHEANAREIARVHLEAMKRDLSMSNAAQRVPAMLAPSAGGDRISIARWIIEKLGRKTLKAKEQNEWVQMLFAVAAGEAPK